MVYGLALTLVVLFMPGGMVQAWHLVSARLRGGNSGGAGRPGA